LEPLPSAGLGRHRLALGRRHGWCSFVNLDFGLRLVLDLISPGKSGELWILEVDR